MEQFTFTAELWRWKGAAPAAWHFVTLPKDLATKIRFYGLGAPGFGMVKISAKIGQSRFSTSLFPDRKSGSFLLPVKATVRKAEKIGDGDRVKVTLSVAAP